MADYDRQTIERLWQEIQRKEAVGKMTDGEVARGLTKEIWGRIPMWTQAGALLDEAITRLKGHDTRRRWQERKERRAAKRETA
jgi:hypothetical protein